MSSRFPTQEEWEKRCDQKARFDRAGKTQPKTNIAPDGSLALGPGMIYWDTFEGGTSMPIFSYSEARVGDSRH